MRPSIASAVVALAVALAGALGSGINRVSKWSKDGKFLMSWGKTGSGRGEFNVPHTIAFDSRSTS